VESQDFLFSEIFHLTIVEIIANGSKRSKVGDSSPKRKSKDTNNSTKYKGNPLPSTSNSSLQYPVACPSHICHMIFSNSGQLVAMLSRSSLTFGRRHLAATAAAASSSNNSASYWFSSTSAALQQQYDVVVIGGGPGGYVAAIKAGQLGLKTACVEMRGTLGGTCLNVGCIPSKALLTSSHHFHDAKHHFADHGIQVGEVTMDVSKMLDAKAKTVQGLTGGIEHLLKKHKVDYFVGKGSLSGPNGVAVTLNAGGNENLSTKHIIIATGSEVTPLPPVPVNNALGKIVDSTGALDISTVPNSMAVIGGGVIGLEMGSVWSRLGSKVTVIEFMDRLCPAMDQELTKKFQATLKKQGFQFKLKTKVVKSEVLGDSVAITTEPSKVRYTSRVH
jgi:dihydrolipoamide dehydrogenase